MAGRIRSIKPEILEDEKTAHLTHLEWRIFVSLWMVADDYGNLRGDPTYVLGQVLWGSRESRETVEKALETLARVSLLSRYWVRGQSYLHITNWERHQKVDKPGKPRMPGPNDPEARAYLESDEEFAGNSRESRESLATDLRPTTRTTTASGTGETRPDDPTQRRALAERVYRRISDARLAIAAELGLAQPIAFPQITPASVPRGYRDLADRIREEGPRAEEVCDHVVAMLVQDARTKRSIEWLSEKAFSAGSWRTARERVPSASHSFLKGPTVTTKVMTSGTYRITEDENGEVIASERVS